ncbi:MAG TPA: hypothetical protein VEV82_09930 [Actinomycetota bacterium]|nr:hypothetical protein [Actinomycetota bacterium]
MPTRLLLVAIMAQGALIVAATPAAAAAPQTTILSGPSGLIASRSAAFGFKSSLRSSTFQCKLDTGNCAKCTSPKTYTSLAQGSRTFRVRARKNGVVDPTPATRTFTVDTVRPQTTITEAPSARIIHDGSPTFQFTSSEPGTFRCRLDNAAFASCTSPFAPELLPDRIYTFQVRARDVAGNADATPASYQFSKVSLLSFSQETGEALAEQFFPDQATMDIPASCGGDPEIDCPGGVPAPPADQLSMSSTRSVLRQNGSNRYDVTATMAVATLQPFTMNYSGIECQVTLNSANGTTPTWTATVQMDVVTDATFGERYISSSNLQITGMDDEDYELTGDFLCNLGGSFISASQIQDQLEGVLADQMPPQCMAPGPALFETCPWVEV